MAEIFYAANPKPSAAFRVRTGYFMYICNICKKPPHPDGYGGKIIML